MKILLVVLLIALVIYGVTRAIERRGLSRPQRPQRPQQPPRAVAPDDDPDFLADLDFERRRQQKRRTNPSNEPPSDPDTPRDEPS